MKKNFSSFCLFFYLCTLYSVAFAQKDFYIPKALITPLHNSQQQLFTSVGVGSGLTASVSYALSPHIAVFATGTVDKGTHKRTPFILGDRYNIVKNDRVFTYGAGYFTQLKGKLNVLETYAGYGTNKVNNYWYFTNDRDLGSNYTKTNYNQVFCQVNIGRKTASHDWIFAGRFSYTNYGNILFYDTSPNTSDEKEYYKNMQAFNFDPAVGFSYRFKSISFSLQGGISIPLSAGRYTSVSSFTTYENGAQVITTFEGTATETLLEAFGRLSIDYNFTFKKQKNE